MLQPLRCRFRESVRTNGREETARCGVLQEIVGLDDPERFRVGRDACAVCQQSVLPSPERINQVIASFLHAITDEIIKQEGVPGCDLQHAEELHRWAANHLEVCLSVQSGSAFQDRSHERCCHFGGPIGQHVDPSALGHVRTVASRCLHPDHGTATEEDCRWCRDWASSPSRAPRLAELLGGPADRGGSTVRKWAVGVTTAPRRQATLDTCLEYLNRSGWDNPRLFVDDRVPALASRHSHLPVTLRQPSVGAWPNYYLSLQELLCRHPDADALMLVQDDACFYDRECLRDYLEQILWPTDPPGLVSLYCSSAYTNEQAGWQPIAEEWVWGALAFIFPRERAIQFVTDPGVIAHRWKKTGGLKLIDEAIGKWALRAGVPIHFPTPSLVQHVGVTSTLWPGMPSAGFRRADWFAGSSE